MERVQFVKMLGIFLTLLIGYAAADKLRMESYLSSYLHQQQYEAQMNLAQQQREQTPTSNQQVPAQQHQQLSPQQQQYSGESPTKATKNFGNEPAVPSISSRGSPTQHQLTNTNEMTKMLMGTRYIVPQRAPKQGQPLLQARPHPSAALPSQANDRPIWGSTTQVNSNAFNNWFDTKAVAVASASATNAAADFVPAADPETATNSHNKFNADLFHVIASSLPQRNIVYSPISLQLLLAFVYIGASGQTALQMQRALSLPPNIAETENLFYNLLQTHLHAGANTQLVIANKMYHNRQLTVQSDMQQRARYFDSEIEPIDFSVPHAAAATINGWVAQKTQNIIRQLLTPEQLDAQTQAILVSAIHFKAKWAKQFSTTDTEQQKFYVTPQRTVNVDMMYNDDTYRYGEFPELDATGLEMPYANSNMSMLLLLPNKLNGLAAMEQRLQGIDFNSLTGRMQMESVELRMPKFTVDFELDMSGSLRRLGISDLFTDRAELKGFFRSQSVAVSQMQHKAFLDVNEAGSEAAAASFIKLIPLSLPSRIIHFTADHPFMFAIRSPQAVFFIGHVVNI